MDHQSSDHSQRNGLSKSAYETAFELAAVGMAMVSPQGHWIRVNRCLCEIVGYTESELLKLAFQDITHPEDLDTDMHLVNQMLSGKIETYSLEKRYIHKNGSLIWILLTVALVWNQDGTPRHFISCVQNIMARKKAQDDLRTHRWQLKLLLDHAPAALALFDRNMRYIECSERWLTDYGLTGQTLRGKRHYDIFPELPEHWKRIHQRALHGESIREEEDVFVRQDGSVNYLRWEVIPWYESLDTVGGLVIFTEDITQRIQAEKQLRLASWVFQNSAQGIMVTDANGIMLSVNPMFTDITGFQTEEVIGQSARILKSGRQDTAFYEEMWKAIQDTGQWHGEIWNRRKNGDIYPEHLYISTVLDNKGMVQCRIGMFTDISEQKAAEEAIAYQANYDQLTKLPNRRLFHDRLEQALKRSHREKSLTALLFIDLDHFKDINDSQGHAIGDRVLAEAAQRITQCIRDYDTVSRFGGDEFTVILSDVNDIAAAGRIGNDIVNRLSVPFTIEQQDFYLSASIGIALYPDDASSTDALIK
ncbi:MAG: PAS domain S-box protein [Hahellaceae bacterium]|nr:PAS domain S-box protein [Hahellaceae bacterium]